jgi:hypothetical protein
MDGTTTERMGERVWPPRSTNAPQATAAAMRRAGLARAKSRRINETAARYDT